MHIYPVILSGGSGTRLWPMSRESCPKQFLPLLNGRSPFQATLGRLNGFKGLQPPLIVTNQEHRFLALDQIKATGITPLGVYLEPFGRNTSPAAAVAAISLLSDDPDAIMLVLPADHDIPDEQAFRQAVSAGTAAAQAQRLVVFGVEARWPETGYGYIERGEPLGQLEGCYQVARFVEKPEFELARRFVESGRHYWNSGIFLFSAARFIGELRRFQPEVEAVCQDVAGNLIEDHGCCRIDAAHFARCRSISIDYAVLEHTEAAAVVPGAFRWSDIGSWNALWEAADKDAQGNVTQGDVHVDGVSGSCIYATQRMVVAIGLENLVIAETPDALLVAGRNEAQRVREAVERLRSEGRTQCRAHRTVYRPWGCYEDVDSGDRFRVKRITVNPGAKLSLQLHHHRAEHWVVVSGTARITHGEEVTLLTENQSTHIPLGVRHRLENPGKIPLQIIEIQSGAYLAEDDIVRIEDAYHRA
ncbi:MAG: mannose-1-phosphate guanylyltransferase/mannose-6-phosphate isomerase [Betaproteobacteria bacterium]|nr:mannose-1-phosphate guanylyltransferase/mannose-6-phosphate isomerase [Betaproteobacteria bacterium]